MAVMQAGRWNVSVSVSVTLMLPHLQRIFLHLCICINSPAGAHLWVTAVWHKHLSDHIITEPSCSDQYWERTGCDKRQPRQLAGHVFPLPHRTAEFRLWQPEEPACGNGIKRDTVDFIYLLWSGVLCNEWNPRPAQRHGWGFYKVLVQLTRTITVAIFGDSLKRVSWLAFHGFTGLGKNLQPPLIFSHFHSKKPDVLVFLLN